MQQAAYKDPKIFRLSQSSIKQWGKVCPSVWYTDWVLGKRKDIDTQPLAMGNMIDTIRFNPELFDKRFVIADFVMPSDNIRLTVKAFYEHITELNSNAVLLNKENKTRIPYKAYDFAKNKDFILKKAIDLDFYAKKPEQAYNKVLDQGQKYLDLLKRSGKATVITPKEKEAAEELANILITDPVSRRFFEPERNREVIFQQQIFADMELSGFDSLDIMPMKGMLDILHFNHKRKEVREVDLKYTNDVFMFWNAIKQYDYGSQHSVYDFLIREWLKVYLKGKYADYTVMPPLNVVIDDVIKKPYLYEYSPEDLHIKRYGIPGTPIRGWEDTVNDIAWHIDKNDWSRPKEHIMNGKIRVHLFNKK